MPVSELLVLESVSRWSHRRCCRLHLPVTAENKRAVLGGAQYHVRYYHSYTISHLHILDGSSKTKYMVGPPKDGILRGLVTVVADYDKSWRD